MSQIFTCDCTFKRDRNDLTDYYNYYNERKERRREENDIKSEKVISLWWDKFAWTLENIIITIIILIDGQIRYYVMSFWCHFEIFSILDSANKAVENKFNWN